MQYLRRPAKTRIHVPSLVSCFMLCLLTSQSRAQLEQQPTDFEAAPPPQKAPQLTRAPELLKSVDPIFPPEAQAEGRGGEVVLQITIDAAGRVTRLDVKQSAGADLDFAAMGAAANFIFSPAEIDGKAAPVALEYRTVFEVQEVVTQVEAPAPELPENFQEAEDTRPVNLIGLVREAGTKAPLAGVEIVLEPQLDGKASDAAVPDAETLDDGEYRSEYSDSNGRFAFRGLPPGKNRLSFGYPGFEPAYVEEKIEEGKRSEIIVYLTPRQTNQFETVVRERRAQKEVSKIALSREEVRRVPGTFGDPLRVIENLPGLARAPFAGGALIVRGANPQDSGVYFDGVQIPLLYHFGGLTSVVNPEFLEDINFYPGGFGAYYGRATAGIVDVDSRKLNLNRFRGYAEVDLLDAGFFFGGPLKIGNLPTFTFAAAARRSYIDALIPIVLEAVTAPGGQSVVATPVYWDYQVKIEAAPIPGNRFSLFAFGSDDDLKVITSGGNDSGGVSLGVKQAFHRLVGRWETRLPGGVRHFFQPYVGLNWNDLGFDSELGLAGDVGIYTWDWGIRDELRVTANENFEFAVGLDYLANTFGVEFSFPVPQEVGGFPRVVPRFPPENQKFGSDGLTQGLALYSEAVLKPFSGFTFVPGIRAEYAGLWINDQDTEGSEVEGIDVGLWNVDPRLTFRWDALKNTTLKGAFGLYRQTPNGQQLSQESGNPYLNQPRALQTILGVEQSLSDSLFLDVQMYFTSRDLLVQGTNEVALRGEGEVDPISFTNQGRGRTSGIEVLLRQNVTKNFYGWIAYTLSRSEIDLSEDFDVFRLTGFDQTHILTVVGQSNLPYGFTVGGRFRLVSGNPTTLPVGSLHDLDTTNYGRLASVAPGRLPAFNQLDIRIDRKWVFDNFSMVTYLDLLNVYNAQNAEGYQDDYRYREREPISSLPILPVLGLSGEF